MRHRIHVGKDAHKFSAAHMTVFPNGSKESLHGHNFQVSVAIDLKDISFRNFLDFSIIKRTLATQCGEWDDKLLLAEHCPFFKLIHKNEIEIEFTLCDKRYVIPADEVILLPLENIATETLTMEFAHRFAERLNAESPKLLQDVIAGIETNITESRGQGGTYYFTPDA